MSETPAPQGVTPARKIADPQPSSAEDRPTRPPRPAGTSVARPIAISALYLGGFVIGFSPILGIILAHVWSGDKSTSQWEQTHFTYLITTFWVGLLINVVLLIGFIAALFTSIAEESYSRSGGDPPVALIIAIFGGVLLWGGAALWFCIRCIVSIVKASSAQPISRPRTWLF